MNVIGLIEGGDPALKDELIILGGHLDHLGRLWELMPGANDNATAVAVTLGVAEAMSKCAGQAQADGHVPVLRGGRQDQGTGARISTTSHLPLEKTAAFINMEGPGIGDRI